MAYRWGTEYWFALSWCTDGPFIRPRNLSEHPVMKIGQGLLP
jgi:hypothetical protein